MAFAGFEFIKIISYLTMKINNFNHVAIKTENAVQYSRVLDFLLPWHKQRRRDFYRRTYIMLLQL